jgi:hypothetical protein
MWQRLQPVGFPCKHCPRKLKGVPLGCKSLFNVIVFRADILLNLPIRF